MPRRRADPDAAAAQTVQRLLNETRPGFDAHLARTRRYDRSYEVWRSPENPNDRQGRPDWKPLLKVKYAMQSIDQATVAVAQGVPGVRCTPRNEDSVEKAKAMQQVLTYYADLDHLPDKAPLVVQQALVYGNSPSKTSWLYEEERGIIKADRPSMEPLDVYDVWWDPAASTPDNASYVVCRYWPTKDDLLRREYNDATGIGSYKNLELLFSSGPGAERPQTAQNLLLDADMPAAYRNRFEIWEVWRNDRLTVIGNRQILLYDGPPPFILSGKPVSISVARPDFLRMEGIPETEMLDHLQQTLHAEDSLRLENFRFAVQRGITYRETIPDPKALVIQPHFMWPVGDHDDVRFVDQPDLPQSAYREHDFSLSLMQLATGINQYVTGAQGADQQTATGASLFTQSASRLLVFKAQLISHLTWQRTFEQWADLTKQFLTSEQEVAIRGPGEQIDFVRAGPQSIYGDYDVRIESAEESLNKQQRQASLIQFLNAAAPMIQSGQMDPRPIYRELADAFGLSATALFPPPAPQMPQAAPNNGGQFAQGPTPYVLGDQNGAQQLAPQPALSVLAGNQR